MIAVDNFLIISENTTNVKHWKEFRVELVKN